MVLGLNCHCFVFFCWLLSMYHFHYGGHGLICVCEYAGWGSLFFLQISCWLVKEGDHRLSCDAKPPCEYLGSEVLITFCVNYNLYLNIIIKICPLGQWMNLIIVLENSFVTFRMLDFWGLSTRHYHVFYLLDFAPTYYISIHRLNITKIARKNIADWHVLP